MIWTVLPLKPKALAEEPPLRLVLSSVLYWTGNPHKAGPAFGHHFLREKLECGHVLEIRRHLQRKARRRRCDDCQIEAKAALEKGAHEHGPVDSEVSQTKGKD